ncbi:putative uncharacterized protein [Firmicutes bacterium CAG:129]|nr:putative uncharacterized protein [Firmicutes bacterium CAG:129]
MKVLVVEPGYAPYEKDIEGLHGMQEVVGGTITAIYPFAEPVAVVGNDDSISLGMPFTALLRELSAIGNNVNQIAYWANAQQSASEADIQEAAALVRRAWRLVKETL